MEDTQMNNFNGLDIVTERRVEETTIRRAIAVALSLPEERISVTNNITPSPMAPYDAVCTRTAINGQFAEILAIQCKKRDLPQLSELEVFTQLAHMLGVRCLMADEGPNPYIMWASDSGSAPTRVSMDPVSLDENHYNIE
jgi:hypothetical protein